MFTLLLLLNNPDKFQALVQEILTAFPDKDEPIVFAATQELPYLNAAINESMRLMPIVLTGLPRETTETTFIDGYEIPKKVRFCWSFLIMYPTSLPPLIDCRWLCSRARKSKTMFVKTK
jgi:cytochrome P450